MSCCPSIPAITVDGSGDEDLHAQDTNIRKGETVECYARRAGNMTGRMDDKTVDVTDKIRNTDIPLGKVPNDYVVVVDRGKIGIFVDVTFRLTPNSTRTPTSWEMRDADDNVITNFNSTVTFSSSTGILNGAFSGSDIGRSIKITISAKDSTGDIDSRGFVFSPALATGSNEIKFLHPLPGSIVTSKFGPRTPPASGASSMHGGADFAHVGGKITDVLAAADGEVEFTGFQNGGAGNYVKIKHLNAVGKHLCTSVYMHLNKIYVNTGQQVSAGQKIGLEGNTGIGTGSHLHFECRLPNGTKIDPVPLIKGSLDVAQETNADNTAKTGTLETQNSTAVLTPENVAAKESGCVPFGPTYPPDPTETSTPVPVAPLTDPFEQAWFFTMQHEVGPAWTTSSPSDAEIAAGLIETVPQRKKVGYVNLPSFPGGETKFGIAQGPNPSINVKSIDYDSAKKTGYNNYWKRGCEALVATKPKTAIMLFDLNYLHGVGNANVIKSNASITSLTDAQAIDALSAAQQAFMQNIIIQNPQRQRYIAGWLKRSRDLLAYVKSI